MGDRRYILSLDQGTTSSRAIVFDRDANIIAVAQQEFPQHYPHNGWVEHDPEDIWNSTLAVAKEAFDQAEQSGTVAAIGTAVPISCVRQIAAERNHLILAMASLFASSSL